MLNGPVDSIDRRNGSSNLKIFTENQGVPPHFLRVTHWALAVFLKALFEDNAQPIHNCLPAHSTFVQSYFLFLTFSYSP